VGVPGAFPGGSGYPSFLTGGLPGFVVAHSTLCGSVRVFLTGVCVCSCLIGCFRLVLWSLGINVVGLGAFLPGGDEAGGDA
jgi:hypothetical protein